MTGVREPHERLQSRQIEDSSQISDDLVHWNHNARWWEWCSDPKIEASILAVSMLVAVVTWGFVVR